MYYKLTTQIDYKEENKGVYGVHNSSNTRSYSYCREGS